MEAGKLDNVMAALNTLKASWIELILARIFGKTIRMREGTSVIILKLWLKKYYLIDTKRH